MLAFLTHSLSYYSVTIQFFDTVLSLKKTLIVSGKSDGLLSIGPFDNMIRRSNSS